MDPFDDEIVRYCQIPASQVEILRRTDAPGDSQNSLEASSTEEEAIVGHVPVCSTGIVIRSPPESSEDDGPNSTSRKRLADLNLIEGDSSCPDLASDGADLGIFMGNAQVSEASKRYFKAEKDRRILGSGSGDSKGKSPVKEKDPKLSARRSSVGRSPVAEKEPELAAIRSGMGKSLVMNKDRASRSGVGKSPMSEKDLAPLSSVGKSSMKDKDPGSRYTGGKPAMSGKDRGRRSGFGESPLTGNDPSDKSFVGKSPTMEKDAEFLPSRSGVGKYPVTPKLPLSGSGFSKGEPNSSVVEKDPELFEAREDFSTSPKPKNVQNVASVEVPGKALHGDGAGEELGFAISSGAEVQIQGEMMESSSAKTANLSPYFPDKGKSKRTGSPSVGNIVSVSSHFAENGDNHNHVLPKKSPVLGGESLAEKQSQILRSKGNSPGGLGKDCENLQKTKAAELSTVECGNADRALSRKHTEGTHVNFGEFQYRKLKHSPRFPPLKLFKEAIGITETTSTDVQGLQNLPPSIKALPDKPVGNSDTNVQNRELVQNSVENAEGSDSTVRLPNYVVRPVINTIEALEGSISVGLPPSVKLPTAKSERATSFLELINPLTVENDHSIGDEDILDVAIRAGYKFTPPRWHQPGGYS